MNIPVTTASLQIREAPLGALASIHSPGSVQTGATLLLFRPDTDQLAVASDNLETLFNAPAASLIGSDLARFFCTDDRTALLSRRNDVTVPHSRAYLLSDGTPVWGTVFETGGLLGIELTGFDNLNEDLNTSSLRFSNVLKEIGHLTNNMLDEGTLDVGRLGAIVVDRFRMLSGYDRVMMYHFDCDWCPSSNDLEQAA